MKPKTLKLTPKERRDLLEALGKAQAWVMMQRDELMGFDDMVAEKQAELAWYVALKRNVEAE